MTGKYVITQDDLIPVRIAEPQSVQVIAESPQPLAVVLIEGPQGPQVDFVSTVIAGANGAQTMFALPNQARYPSQIQVFRNGLRETLGIGFTATATTITFSTAPLTTDVVAVFYERY